MAEISVAKTAYLYCSRKSMFTICCMTYLICWNRSWNLLLYVFV